MFNLDVDIPSLCIVSPYVFFPIMALNEVFVTSSFQETLWAYLEALIWFPFTLIWVLT